MLRAATMGLIDFAHFDPWNKWWWVKFYAILEELARQANLVSSQAQQTYWTAFVANSRMSDESWDSSRANSRAALNGVLKSLYPWRAAEIGTAGTETTQQALVTAFREMYGEPGDPRYEAMQASLKHYFSYGKNGRLTPRQKDQERAQRKAAWEASKQMAAG